MSQELLIQSIIQALTFNVLPIFIGQNIGAILAKRIKLQRLSKYDGNLIVDSDSVLNKIKNIPKQEVDFAKKEFLLPFVEKLSEHISEEDLRIVYNNISGLKVKRNFLPMLLGIVGSYNVKENKIYYAQSSSLGHEFLHMASTTYDEENDLELVGFLQQKNMASIGMGINEGYTELLASRLYNNNKVGGYKTEVKFAKLLELFFEDEKEMTHLYFNHNLPGLIKHLEGFAPREEVVKMILDIDAINMYSKVLGNPLPTVKSIQTQVKLYEWFSRKNEDPEKLQQFRDLICENKMVSMIINKQKIKLYRESPAVEIDHLNFSTIESPAVDIDHLNFSTIESPAVSEERGPRL